jgi:Pyridoxamine 5'-phosphate oxidase
MTREPVPELEPAFSSPGATAVPWSDALSVLRDAEISWLSTVRPDGRPHVTPLITVWVGGAPHIVTGPQERKARNLARNPAVTLTTGTNLLGNGLDVVLEGDVERVVDHGELVRIAAAYADKYPPLFHFQPADAGLDGGDGTALVFRIVARTVFAFHRGETFGQTRYRMEEA